MNQLSPLLLIPGTLCDERLWASVAAQLRGRARCIPIRWGDETSVEAASRRILAAAPECFLLAGMSMGASVALEMCAQAPERVRGLALVGSQPGPDRPDAGKARAALIDVMRDQGPEALIAKLWPNYVHSSRLGDRVVFDLMVAMARDAGAAAYEQQHRLLATRQDRFATLVSLRVPVLIAAGDSDRLCPPSEQARMAAAAPEARRVELPDCGHLAPLEQASTLGRAMLDWVARTSSIARPTRRV